VSHDLKTLSALLDEALDLNEADSEALLARLEQTQPSLAHTLRQLLGYRGKLETNELLTLNGHMFTPQSAAKLIHGTSSRHGDSRSVSINSAISPGTMIGPYRLERCIGEGGMASVWLATRDDETLKRTVALKLLHAWRHTREVVERFRRERDILAQFSHPNIARLFDAGVTESGLPWIALEYVDGEQITVHADEAQLTVRQRIALMLEVMDAVQYAHQSFIVHRDIKPSNVLVDKSGRIRLLDFGIAKLMRVDEVNAANSNETELTQVAGRTLTLRYAAPEQIEGGLITAATDVYALGLVLAELLTGTFPRVATNDAVQARAILDATLVRPSRAQSSKAALTARGKATLAQLQTELRGDLDTIVLKALAKDPAQRYATVSAFAEDLNAWLERRPIRAHAPSLAYRATMFLSRHRWPATLVATVIAVSSIAAVASWRNQEALQQQRARTERLQGFMASLFSESEPTGAQNNEVLTAKILLDRGRERANREYANQPAFRGEILGELAQVYLRIGEAETGTAVLNEAIELLERHTASDEPALNMARAELGSMLHLGAERARGMALLEGAVRDCTRDIACDRVKGNAHLYMSYDPSRGTVGMRDHIEQALIHYLRSPGQYSAEMLMALIAAADLERRQGNVQAAKQRVTEAESVASQLSVKAYEYARLQHVISGIALEEGNFNLARETLDRLIASGVDGRVGRKMRWSIFAIRTHALSGQGFPQLTMESATEALVTIDRRLEPVAFANMMLERARAQATLGQTESAREQHNEALAAIRENGVLEQSEVWSRALRVEGEILARSGDFVNARKPLTEAINRLRTYPPTNTLPMIHALDTLGAVLTASGDFTEAMRIHQEELDLLQHRPSANRPLHLRAALQLARARQLNAPSEINTNEIRTLMAQLIQLLPEQSHYRRILSDIDAGTFGANQVLLLF
jgi:eukaryotic-like serine/threonine-protein kinase